MGAFRFAWSGWECYIIAQLSGLWSEAFPEATKSIDTLFVTVPILSDGCHYKVILLSAEHTSEFVSNCECTCAEAERTTSSVNGPEGNGN